MENGPKNGTEDLLGPWEPCIIGVKPYEEVSKTIADFIFINVISNPDNGEIINRGVQFEIEAKLGTLIDKDTNERVDKYVSTECVLQDTGRIAFKSSMSAVSGDESMPICNVSNRPTGTTQGYERMAQRQGR